MDQVSMLLPWGLIQGKSIEIGSADFHGLIKEESND